MKGACEVKKPLAPAKTSSSLVLWAPSWSLYNGSTIISTKLETIDDSDREICQLRFKYKDYFDIYIHDKTILIFPYKTYVRTNASSMESETSKQSPPLLSR